MEMEMEMEMGLVGMATEVLHKVALSGWLEFVDVDYGRDIHYALNGVMYNVRGKRWRSARFAVRRKWFVEGVEEESVWREVASVVVGAWKIELENEEELGGWEDVMLATLSLPRASGWEEVWA